MPAEDRVAAGRTPPSGRRSIANEFGSDLYSPLRASIAANRARCSSSVSDQTLTFASTARVGLPQLAIENCNRRRNLCSPRRLLIRHSFLERVHRLRGDFTSGGLRLGLRASIVSGRFGRPSGYHRAGAIWRVCARPSASPETASCSPHWAVVHMWPARLDRRLERRTRIPGRRVSSVQHWKCSHAQATCDWWNSSSSLARRSGRIRVYDNDSSRRLKQVCASAGQRWTGHRSFGVGRCNTAGTRQ
jgi:hypothetical protein